MTSPLRPSPYLSARQVRILERLLARERGITRDDILDLMYGALNLHEPEWSHKVVHVEVHKLRRILEAHEIRIVTTERVKFDCGARYYIPKEDHAKAHNFLTGCRSKIVGAPKADWDEFVKEEAVK